VAIAKQPPCRLDLGPKLPEICCPKCHLYQLYRGKAHTKCIHCGSQLVISHLRPKLVQKRGRSDLAER
jgi:hypothetical protein